MRDIKEKSFKYWFQRIVNKLDLELDGLSDKTDYHDKINNFFNDVDKEALAHHDMQFFY